MRFTLIAAAVLMVGCSSSPTAPSAAPITANPITVTPPVTTPPVVTAPPVVATPAPNPLLSDPRFNLNFYRQFVLNGGSTTLRRQTQAPRIYLRTVDDANRAIDALTLDQTAAAMIDVAGKLTGVFGLAGLEQGTDTRQGQPGWITVRWDANPSPDRFCGYGVYAGDLMILYPRTAGCRCAGGPAVALATVKHELGHVLGFYHTDQKTDLMYPALQSCDMQPSEREIFHARVAYSQPIGSLDPK